jgi:hypothetical protein
VLVDDFRAVALDPDEILATARAEAAALVTRAF